MESKLAIALEEADESEYWLMLLTELEMGVASARRQLLGEASQLTAIFSASLRTHKAAETRSRKLRDGAADDVASRPPAGQWLVAINS